MSAVCCCFAALILSSHAFAEGRSHTTSIFAPTSTPAIEIHHLSLFVLEITGAIFVCRCRPAHLRDHSLSRAQRRTTISEPAQIYGSNQVELAWTVIPVLIVVVLFLTTARVIFAIQDAPKPQAALEVTVVGHQFWWEYRYPKQGIVAANELHVPLSSTDHPTPTYIKLLSADVDHSFWVPQLAGKDRPDSKSPKRHVDRSAATRASISDSARSSAESSTPICCCGFTWIRRSSSRPGSSNQAKPGVQDPVGRGGPARL